MPNTRFGIPAYLSSPVEAASNLHRYDGGQAWLPHAAGGDRAVAAVPKIARRIRRPPKLRILMGLYVTAEQYEKGYYRQALRVRSLIRRDFAEAFDPAGRHRLDALLTPTTPTTAFEIGALYGDSVLMQYADLLTVPANHAGTPGLSLPAGFDRQRLPIGLQLLGPDFGEAMLLRVGRAWEKLTETEPWRAERPKVLMDAGL
jgi:aspartyl-tRNA(Asn)/glutamyl-tRNA(Gln) amidotransferase subunit A